MSEEESPDKQKFKLFVNTEIEELQEKDPRKYKLFLSEQAMKEIFEMQILSGVREPATIIEEALAFYNFCYELENKGYTISAKRKWWHIFVLILTPSRVKTAMASFRKEQEECKKIFKPKVVP